MIDRSLERLLSDTARGVEYPATPDLSARVVASLREPVALHVAPRRPAFGLALLVTALVVVAALAISPSRDAIARLFGVEGSRIEFLPTPAPGITPTPFPTAVPTSSPPPGVIPGVDLNTMTELVGFDAALPVVAEERSQSTVYFYGGDGVVLHTYPSFELWQSRLQGHASFGKQVRPDGTVEEIEVGDVPGLWVTGPEHIVSYSDRNGAHIPASQRIVDTNTLIWRTDAFFYRIETDLALEETLRIAETLP
jgi:hypothetical protein